MGILIDKYVMYLEAQWIQKSHIFLRLKGKYESKKTEGISTAFKIDDFWGSKNYVLFPRP